MTTAWFMWLIIADDGHHDHDHVLMVIMMMMSIMMMMIKLGIMNEISQDRPPVCFSLSCCPQNCSAGIPCPWWSGQPSREIGKKKLEFLKIESSLNNDHCLHLLRGRKRGGKAAKVVAQEIHVVLSSSHLQQQGYLMEITYWKFKWVWLPFHVQVTARLLLINLATSLVQEGEPFHLPE